MGHASVILLDTDHINVLQSREPRAVTLMANMAASADQDFATTVITIEEQMRGWLAVIHRSIALANGALLLSANLRDFEQVPNLRVENWLV
ncbi:MAG: hypothetical protein NTW96_25805 [Planctomycetia bacterium]|nr:hypothetical protein [Planctomycetia bacterium]